MSDNQELQERAEGLMNRAKAITFKPAETWPIIAKETDEPKQVFLSYVMPLAAIGPIASFIGGQLFPISFMGVTVKTPLMAGITGLVMGYILALVGVWLIAFIANLLSKQFEGRDDFPAAFRLTAYAMTAAWIAAIFGLLPALAILGLLGGLYSLYLFYKGASPMMGIPEDKSVVYTVCVVLVAIVVNFIMASIIGAITATMMIGASSGVISSSSDGTDVNIDSPYGSIQINEEDGTATMRIEGNGETMTIEVPTEEEE